MARTARPAGSLGLLIAALACGGPSEPGSGDSPALPISVQGPVESVPDGLVEGTMGSALVLTDAGLRARIHGIHEVSVTQHPEACVRVWALGVALVDTVGPDAPNVVREESVELIPEHPWGLVDRGPCFDPGTRLGRHPLEQSSFELSGLEPGELVGRDIRFFYDASVGRYTDSLNAPPWEEIRPLVRQRTWFRTADGAVQRLLVGPPWNRRPSLFRALFDGMS